MFIQKYWRYWKRGRQSIRIAQKHNALQLSSGGLALVIAASIARSFVQISKRDRTQRVMPRLKTLFAAVFV